MPEFIGLEANLIPKNGLKTASKCFLTRPSWVAMTNVVFKRAAVAHSRFRALVQASSSWLAVGS